MGDLAWAAAGDAFERVYLWPLLSHCSCVRSVQKKKVSPHPQKRKVSPRRIRHTLLKASHYSSLRPRTLVAQGLKH